MKRNLLFGLLSLTVFAGALSGQVIQINFAHAGGSPAGWNEIVLGPVSDMALTDENENATDFTLSSTLATGTGSATTGGTFPASVEGSYLRTNNDPDFTKSVTISGFDLGTSYDIQIFASTTIFAAGSANYTLDADVNGSMTTIDPHSPSYYTWSDVSDLDGTITLTIDASGNAGNAQRLGTINAMTITPNTVPEPAHAALFSGLIGVLFICLRRRKS